MTKLHLAPDFSLPAEAITQTFGILSVRGAGKTNLAAVMAEEMFGAKLPFCVIDPVGSWYGLRSTADGKPGGLSIPIFGGKHGDLPLERGIGNLLSDLVVDRRLSCVLDLSTFDSETSKKSFLLDFAIRLYKRNENPLHLFLEEADDYIPQRPMRDEAHLLRAWENIVRRGRSRGLGITLITQRSAALNKNVLTQIETLFALRTTSPQDQAAVKAWIQYHAQSQEVLESLSGLGNGECWVWSPSWLGLMKRIKVRRRHTFDSGATPKNVSGNRPIATLADVDLGQLKDKMAATVEKAKQEDPRELRRQIAELRKEAAKAKPAQTVEKVKTEIKKVEVPLLKDSQISRLEKLVDKFEKFMGTAAEVAGELSRALGRAKNPLPQLASPRPNGTTAHRDMPQHVAARRPPKPQGELADFIGKCHRAILQVLAQHEEGCTAGKLTLLAGYRFSGGFKNCLSDLRTAGLIEGPNTGVMRITEAGLKTGPYEALPYGERLADYWLQHSSFGVCERRILEALISVHPQGLIAEQLCEKTGYQFSGGFKNSLSNLRTAGVIVGKNTEEMRASENLFAVT